MTALDDLAAQVHTLQKQVTGLTRPSQLANSSIEQAGETLDLADAATTAVGLPATIAGLQEVLDTNEETLAAVKIDVQAAIDAAQEASDAGVAAGEEASAAADKALENATTALNAAADAQERAQDAADAATAAGIKADGASEVAATAQAAAQAVDQKATDAAAAAAAAQVKADAALAQTINKVNDSSFEASPSPWLPLPSSRYSITSAQAHSGAKSLQINTTTTTSSYLIGTTVGPVQAGQVWRFRAWTKTTSDYNGTSSNGKMRIGGYAAGSSTSVLVGNVTWPVSPDGWTLNEYTYTVPNSVPYQTLDMRLSFDHTVGTIWLDDLDVRDITDAKAALDTAAAANAAATTAAAAATAAQTTANGKNAVTYSTAVPTAAQNPGTRAGDIWFVRNANGWLSAQYEWTGSAWTLRSLDSAILAYIDAGKITVGTLAADRLGANSITAAKLAADSVTSAAILAGTIQAVDIASGTITGDRIAAATLTAGLLMADTLTSREIGADAILARNIKAAEITGDKIAARTIAAGSIQANSITAAEIKAGTITADQIAANSITANEINLDSLNGKTLTGATIRSAATGQRSEIVSNNISFYASSNAAAGAIAGVLTTWNNIDYAAVSIGGGSGGCLIHNPIPYYPAPTGLGPLQVTMTNARDAMIRKVLLNTSVGAYAGVYYPDGTNVYPIIHPSGGFADGWTVTAEKFNVTTVLPNGTTGPTYQTAIARTFVNGAYGVVVTADDFRRPDGTTILPAAGTANYNSSVAAGGNATIAVTFPTNRFASAPVVVCTPSNGRFTAAVTSVTKTGFSISLTNVTSAAGTPGNVTWIAQLAG